MAHIKFGKGGLRDTPELRTRVKRKHERREEQRILDIEQQKEETKLFEESRERGRQADLKAAKTEQELLDSFTKEAERRVKKFLVLREVAKKESIAGLLA